MPKDKRFDVTITARVSEVSGEEAKPFANDTVEYFDVPYGDLVAVEAVWAELHRMLVQLGEKRIKGTL